MSNGVAVTAGVVLRGAEANDHLTGGDGDDTLYGYGGDDTLEGGAGDDLLEGGPGRNTLYGGLGSDTASYASAPRNVVVNLNGKDTTGYGLIDILDSIENAIGSDGDDVFAGDASANRFVGGRGNDQLWGNGGDDKLYGGEDDDILQGGDGDDYQNGEAGADTADYSTAHGPVSIDLGLDGAQDTGNAGRDTLVSVENIKGTTFDDVLIGNAAANVFSTGGGSDFIDGRGGSDTAMFGDASGYSVQAVADGTFTVTSRYNGSVQTLKNVEIARFATASIYLTFDFSIATNKAFTSILRAMGQDPTQAAAAMSVFNVSVTGAPMTAVIDTIIKAADKTTSVATLGYLFFTGKIPSQSGYDYLISPTGPNPDNINSAYYQSFNLENRYINFAVNLGKFGDGKILFLAQYGDLSLFEATRQAYKSIFGAAPSDAKIHALIDDRTAYFAGYGGDGPNGIGTKAAMVGWLLAEGEKADVGVMARSNAAWLTDLADGSAPFAIDILDPAKGYWKPDFIFGG